MSVHRCFNCHVHLHDEEDSPVMFTTLVVAESRAEAVERAAQIAMEKFPDTWFVIDAVASVISKEILEEIAETVLGWQRPVE